MNPPHPSQPLLLLDYDGTLAELATDPSQAHPHPEVLELLTRLQEHHPVVVLTGRQVADVATLLPVKGLRIFGVHGMEEGFVGESVRSLASEEALTELDKLRHRFPEHPAIRLEDKGSALALHYRGAEHPAEVEALLKAWCEGLSEKLEPLWGKMLLEIRPRGYNKGQIANRLAAEYPEHTPVFLGDDTTDEDAFKALEDGVTIKIGEGNTSARYRLPDVAAAVAYLKRFVKT